MITIDDFEAGDWVLYHWQTDGPGSAERIGKIVATGDRLTLVPPGSYEDLAFKVEPSNLTRRWVPEGIPDAGRGQPDESIEMSAEE